MKNTLILEGSSVIAGFLAPNEIDRLGAALDAITGDARRLPEDLRDLLTLERDLSPRQRGREWRPDEIATIECTPGALVALHPKLVHGSGPNRSPRPRRNILMQWGGPGCGLVGEARELHTGRRPGRE